MIYFTFIIFFIFIFIIIFFEFIVNNLFVDVIDVVHTTDIVINAIDVDNDDVEPMDDASDDIILIIVHQYIHIILRLPL